MDKQRHSNGKHPEIPQSPSMGEYYIQAISEAAQATAENKTENKKKAEPQNESMITAVKEAKDWVDFLQL